MFVSLYPLWYKSPNLREDFSLDWGKAHFVPGMNFNHDHHSFSERIFRGATLIVCLLLSRSSHSSRSIQVFAWIHSRSGTTEKIRRPSHHRTLPQLPYTFNLTISSNRKSRIVSCWTMPRAWAWFYEGHSGRTYYYFFKINSIPFIIFYARTRW